MTIEGNWIAGAHDERLPERQVHGRRRCPRARPDKGTLQFTNCWGIAADSPNQAAALDARRVADDADAAARVREGLRRDAVDPVRGERVDSSQFPALAAFLDGATTPRACPRRRGQPRSSTDFNSQLAGLKTATRSRSSDRCRRTSTPPCRAETTGITDMTSGMPASATQPASGGTASRHPPRRGGSAAGCSSRPAC